MIRTGAVWTLVKSVAGKTITVWGAIPQSETDFEIIASFME